MGGGREELTGKVKEGITKRGRVGGRATVIGS